jgi:uncharacterized protein YbjT (DUF2867 family)
MIQKNVLVVGGTGQVGSMVAKQLVDEGLEVTILVRDNPESQAKAVPLIDMGVRMVLGDLTRPETLSDVAMGMDLIVCTAAALDNSLTPGYEALLLSAKNAMVKHILYLSNYPRIEPLLDMFAGKAEIEQLVMNSPVPYTILRAEPFLGFAVNYMIKMSLQYGYPVGIYAKDEDQAKSGSHYWISEVDVARLCVALLGTPEAFDEVYLAGGDTPLTFAELVELYSELNLVEVPTMVYTEAPVGVPQWMYDIVAQLSQYDSPVPDDLSRFGMVATPLDHMIRN